MTSEAANILSKQYDENYINREIEDIYNKNGLNKPKLLIFDNIPACKLAYKFLLIHLNNNSKNLTDEHLMIGNKLNNLHDFKKIADLGGKSASQTYSRIFNIIKITENYYEQYNMLTFLSDVKTQLLKDLRPNNIDKDKWNHASEETKNIRKERDWNNIINSNVNIFEFKFIDHINYIPHNGVLLGIFLRDYCILCKNPIKIIHEDEIERLHSTEGYAIEFIDSSGINFVNGIKFNPDLYSRIFIKRDIIGKEILSIENVEQRAIAIQFFGYDKLIKELNAKILDVKDEFSSIDNMPISYELYEFEMKVGRFETLRKFRFVKVEDYSTHKKVTLGVPISEQTNTCIGAIAWTFGMTEEEYKPEIQT